MSTTSVTGRLHLDAGTISYLLPDTGGWEIPLESLAVLAELTHGGGAVGQDYDLVFVTRRGRFYRASFYAENRDPFLETLGRELGTTIRPRLRATTESREQVLWPKGLLGKPLFAHRRRERRSLLGRMRDAMGIATDRPELSSAVQTFLKSAP